MLTENAKTLLPRENTAVLKGGCVLLVVLGHLGEAIGYPNPFSFLGCLPVGFFLFVSGYGMMSRMEEDAGYLKTVPRGRILAVLAPFLVANLLYFPVKYALGELDGVAFSQMLIGGRSIVTYSWYIIAILYFYTAFYLSFRLFPKMPLWALLGATVLWIAVMVGMRGGIHRYVSAPCFILGALACRHRARLIPPLARRGSFALLACAAAVCLGVSIYGWSVWGASRLESLLLTVTVVLFCGAMTAACGRFSIRCRALTALSGVSLEFYLIHGLFVLLYRSAWVSIGSDAFHALDRVLLGALTPRRRKGG